MLLLMKHFSTTLPYDLTFYVISGMGIQLSYILVLRVLRLTRFVKSDKVEK
jgi:hypothetical protein